MPEPVQFGLAILEPIRVPSKLLETARELAHKVAGPCQKWWEERSATLAKGKAKQPRSESFAEAAARPAKGLRLDVAGRLITLGDGTTTTASGPLTIRLTYGSFEGRYHCACDAADSAV